jgi:hypothetical protein
MDCFASLAMTAAHCGWLCHCPVRPACSIFMASDTDQPTIPAESVENNTWRT